MNTLFEQILYARDRNSNIKYWKVYITVPENVRYAIINVRTGKYGYPGTLNKKEITEGKNIGKSNETTPYEQALLEVTSTINTQKMKGYKSLEDLGITGSDNSSISLEGKLESMLPKFNTDSKGNLKSMKAYIYNKADIVYHCIGQPKINGVRCFIKWGKLQKDEVINIFNPEPSFKEGAILYSHEGHIYHLPHIENMFSKGCILDTHDIVLDGELYIPNKSINEIRRHIPIQKSDGTISAPSLNPKDVKFFCFDLAIPDVIQSEREFLRKDLFPRKTLLPPDHYTGDTIVNVPSLRINNYDEACKLRDKCIELGYEGAILRNLNATYEFGVRSRNLAKLKKALFEEFKVVDILLVSQTSTRLNVEFVLQNNKSNSLSFVCTPFGDNNLKQKYLDNKKDYIGRMVTVKFYERSGVNNFPFHANVLEIKD